MKNYYKINIKCTVSNQDLISGLLSLKLGINSYEVLENNKHIELVAYLENINLNINKFKELINIYIKPLSIKYSIKNIKYNKKIESSYKKYFKTNKICKNIIIKPSWHKYKKANSNEIIIKIDPGLAFGTGLHESTKGIIKLINLLKNKLDKNSNVLDAGTGSGILSIVSYKLGFKNILAIDNDPEAIKVAKENFIINKTKNIKAKTLDLKEIKNNYDIILANIISGTIIENYKQFLSLCKKNTFIFMSGILYIEQDKVLDIFLKENKFKLIKVLKLKEWISIVLKKN